MTGGRSIRGYFGRHIEVTKQSGFSRQILSSYWADLLDYGGHQGVEKGLFAHIEY